MFNLKSRRTLLMALFFFSILIIQPRLAIAETEFRLLQDEELKFIKGGTNCENVDGESGNTGDDKSKDPVILNNGDLVATFEDLLIPALGPDLGISRTYNSQITSRVDGWQPEKGAGPWAIEDGQYAGHGDRTVTLSQWSDFTLTLDMRTVEPGSNYSWQTARANFRYVNKNNTYYVVIHTDGTFALSKLQGGAYYFLAQSPNTFNPLIYNTIKVETLNNNIKVYLNNILQIDYTDPSPILSGSVALEAYYCWSRFDNVSITNGTQTESYDFNFDDNDTIFGKNWTFNYGLTAKEYPDGSVVILREDGRKDTFTKNPDNSYNPPYKVFDTLSKTTAGFTLRLKNGTEYRFDTDGKLLDITDRNLNKLTLSYSLIAGKLKPVTITDASGRTLSLEYGTNGLVSKITDPMARQLFYYYDTDNNLIKSTDPAGNFCTYTYLPGHLLNIYTDHQGYTYTYTYYYNNRTATQADVAGNTTTFNYFWDTTWVTNQKAQTTFYHFYEVDNQLASVDDMLGNTEYHTYDQYGNPVTYKDKNGRTTTFTYDTKGNMLSKTDPLLNTTTYVYEPNFNQITSITDPKGNQTFFEYDLKGNLIKTTDALGNFTTFEYDIYGNLIKTIDPLNNITTYTYDQYGNRTSVTDALGKITQFTYDLVSRLTSTTDANNHTTVFEYDANDNLIKTTDALGNITTFTYDKDDRVITATDPAGNITTFEYNYAGDITKIIEPQNKITTSTYDLTNYIHLAVSNKLSETDANGNITTFIYDNQNRLIKTTDAKGNITQYFYDPKGNLIKLTDANLHDTYYTYDAADRLITTTYHDTLTEEYTHDNNGNTLTKKDKKGQIITYAYDALNRLITKTYPDLSQITYTYDALSRLLTVTDSSGTITHTYDAVGRLLSVTYPNTMQVSYQYDPVGNRTKLTYPNNDIVTYTYDALNRLIRITTPQNKYINYSYDNLNRIITRTISDVATAAYTYDSLSRLTGLINYKFNGGQIISSFTYIYDNVGNRLSRTSQDGTTNYSYDNIYQLTQTTKPDLSTNTYAFDPVGNRTLVNNISYSINPMNQYTQVGPTNFYDYDLNGSMLSKTVSGWTTYYTYDYENRLTKVTTPNQGEVSFKYDPFGRLIQRNENYTVTNYIYDQDHIIAETNQNNQITRTYLYGTSIDEILTMSKPFDWGVGIWYYNQDGLGSISEITDWQGNLLEKYTYDEYGSFTIKDANGNPLNSSPSGNRFYFTGREYDFLTGLYYYRARYYDPSIGRFLQTDPIGYYGGINLYTYCGNNPVNWKDPFGLESEDWAGDAVRDAVDFGAKGWPENDLVGLGLELLDKFFDWGQKQKAKQEEEKKKQEGKNN